MPFTYDLTPSGLGVGAAGLAGGIGSLFTGLAQGREDIARRKFLEAEAEKMARPSFTTAGRQVLRQNPDGTVSVVHEAPETPQDIYTRELTKAVEQKRGMLGRAEEAETQFRAFRDDWAKSPEAVDLQQTAPFAYRALIMSPTSKEFVDTAEKLGLRSMDIEAGKYERKGAKQPTDLNYWISVMNDPAASLADKAIAKANYDAQMKAKMAVPSFTLNLGSRLQLARDLEQQGRKTGIAAEEKAERIGQIRSDLGVLREAAKGLDKSGLLPPHGATGLDVFASRLQREYLDPTNVHYVRFMQLWSPIMIGEVDRGIFDEKGVRSIQAFQQQIDITKSLPSYRAIEALLATLDQSLQSKLPRVRAVRDPMGRILRAEPIPQEAPAGPAGPAPGQRIPFGYQPVR